MTRSPIITLAAVCTLTLAACGDDGGSSTSAFCSKLAASENVDIGEDEDPTAAIAGLRDLEGSAPNAIKDDLKLLIDALVAGTELDFTTISEDDLAALEEKFADVEGASERVEQWSMDNCEDLPADFFQS